MLQPQHVTVLVVALATSTNLSDRIAYRHDTEKVVIHQNRPRPLSAGRNLDTFLNSEIYLGLQPPLHFKKLILGFVDRPLSQNYNGNIEYYLY